MILARLKLRRLAEPPDLVDAGDPRPDPERPPDEEFLAGAGPAPDDPRPALAG